jgi:hypothetical protein
LVLLPVMIWSSALALTMIMPSSISATPALQDYNTADIGSFNGSEWGGIKLGLHTDPELKRLFKAGKGGIRPESLRFPVQGERKVDALMDARGAKAKVKAIRIEFGSDQDLQPITQGLGVEPVTLYQQDRWEDWSVAYYPGKGVAALQLEGRSFVFLLGNPNLMDQAVRKFSLEETDIVRRPDPGEDWDRVVTYDYVSVRVEQSKTDRVPNDLDSRGRSRLEEDFEERLRRVIRGPLVYAFGNNGSFDLNINIGGYNDKGEADVRYNATLTAETPYGPITVTQSHSLRMKKDYRREVSSGADTVIRRVFGESEKKIRSLGPPPMNAKRTEAEFRLMADLTPER